MYYIFSDHLRFLRGAVFSAFICRSMLWRFSSSILYYIFIFIIRSFIIVINLRYKYDIYILFSSWAKSFVVLLGAVASALPWTSMHWRSASCNLYYILIFIYRKPCLINNLEYNSYIYIIITSWSFSIWTLIFPHALI